jgi:uncharacterized protein (TIGR02646 family)
MIRRTWRDPNLAWRAVDQQGKQSQGIAHANSENELAERLRVRGLTPSEIQDYDFSDWTSQAQQELIAMVDAGPPYKFKDRIWKGLRDHLFDLFAGKCAYCETSPRAGIPGDVEHFRPKHRPKDDADHPGYYWLAYDPQNLLPTCESCNRNPGKARQFPIAGKRAGPADPLDDELPLLVHPIHDDPSEHFEFVESGQVAALTERGEASAMTYGLNRPHLNEARLLAIREVKNDFGIQVIKAVNIPGLVASTKEKFSDEPYGAAKISQLTREMHMFVQAWEDSVLA